MNRILTIQDISGVGKCSLTVALPIISAMQVECSVLPTAVLSTHTMFPSVTCVDLTEYIDPIGKHWSQQGIRFDGIYTGYLASSCQISEVMRLVDTMKKDGFLVVDPAMADHGALYRGFDEEYVKWMKQLCQKANYLLPNMTEACLLTNQSYKKDFTLEEVKELLIQLTTLYCDVALITGVLFDDGKQGVMGYQASTKEFFWYFHDTIAQSFHGTGDVFASTFVGGLARGRCWKDACKLAEDFTLQSVRMTACEQQDARLGVSFEKALPYLIQVL